MAMRSDSFTRSSRGVGDDGVAFGEGGGDRQHGQLVDQARDEARRRSPCRQRAVLHGEVGHRLAAFQAFVASISRSGAHGAQHIEHAAARGIDADAAHGDLRAGHDRAGDQEEGGGGDIARHGDSLPAQALPAAHAHGQAVFLDLHAEAAQHALGVIARFLRLGDRGDAVGKQPGQQDGGFHLRAGDRGGDSRWRAGCRRGRSPAACSASPWPSTSRAHLPQRDGHAVHRAAAQRVIAGEGGAEGLPGEDAHQQAGGGAGVAGPQRLCRRAQAVQADAVHAHDLVPRRCARPSPAGSRRWPAYPRSRGSRVMVVSPSASAPKSSARCEMDLSPGTRIVPRSGVPGATISVDDILVSFGNGAGFLFRLVLLDGGRRVTV